MDYRTRTWRFDRNHQQHNQKAHSMIHAATAAIKSKWKLNMMGIKSTNSETSRIKNTIAEKDIVERGKDSTGDNIFPGTAPPFFLVLLVQNIIVILWKLGVHPLVLVLCSQRDCRQSHFPIPMFLELHLCALFPIGQEELCAFVVPTCGNL